jgi:hypothetical protein
MIRNLARTADETGDLDSRQLSPERVVFPEKADALFPRCTSHDPTQNN